MTSNKATEMSRMRRAIAANMSKSYFTCPTVTLNISADVGGLLAEKKAISTESFHPSLTVLLIPLVAKALRKHMELNVSIEENTIIEKEEINLGIAVAIPGGLLVPVVKNADTKTLPQIYEELNDLIGKARSMKLPRQAMTNGTFSITNLGMYGTESFNPIINLPEAAILGINTITPRVVLENGVPVSKPYLAFSLTFDHRAVDGATAAAFLADLKTLIEACSPQLRTE